LSTHNVAPLGRDSTATPTRPLICFYGDDFTGSADALAQFRRFGLSGILLFEVPQGEQLCEYAREFNVIGVAGVSRALAAAQMVEEVEPALVAFAALGPHIVQYKVCSTFDSSPAVGSIGRLFGDRPVPVLAAQPEFGRYTAFGNHFAAYRGTPYRLDRHPAMERHPSTPMDEGDLCRVLAQQTTLPVSSLNLLQLAQEPGSTQSRLAQGSAGPVVVDAVQNSDLIRAGELIWRSSDRSSPRFVVGSGGLSYGLGGYLAAGKDASPPPAAGVAQVFAVCGSCSPQSAEQVAYAVASGWSGFRLDPRDLGNPGSAARVTAVLLEEALSAVDAGKSVIVYTTDGVAHGNAKRPRRQMAAGDWSARIGAAFGVLIDRVLARSEVRRIVIAGGDTSGYTLRSLAAYGLEVEASLAVAAALCRLRSSAQHLEGVEIVLKGGQVGACDFFELTRRGAADLTATTGQEVPSR
jgi:3-oxoisoapionate kinase